MKTLEGIRDRSSLDQGHRGVDEQRVEREVLVVGERFEDRLGDRAHADLDGGAVGHEARDVATDGPLDLADGRGRIGRERRVHLDPRVHLAPVQERVAEGPRHGRVDLGDHERGAARGGERDADGDAEAQVAARVGRCRVNEHAVGRPRAACDELARDVEVTDRDELDTPAPPRLLEPRRHVPRRVPQRRARGLRPRVVAEVDPAEEREISQPVGLAADLRDERDRLAARRGKQDLHPRPEAADGVGERARDEGARHESRRYIYPIPR